MVESVAPMNLRAMPVRPLAVWRRSPPQPAVLPRAEFAGTRVLRAASPVADPVRARVWCCLWLVLQKQAPGSMYSLPRAHFAALKNLARSAAELRRNLLPTVEFVVARMWMALLPQAGPAMRGQVRRCLSRRVLPGPMERSAAATNLMSRRARSIVAQQRPRVRERKMESVALVELWARQIAARSRPAPVRWIPGRLSLLPELDPAVRACCCRDRALPGTTAAGQAGTGSVMVLIRLCFQVARWIAHRAAHHCFEARPLAGQHSGFQNPA